MQSQLKPLAICRELVKRSSIPTNGSAERIPLFFISGVQYPTHTIKNLLYESHSLHGTDMMTSSKQRKQTKTRTTELEGIVQVYFARISFRCSSRFKWAAHVILRVLRALSRVLEQITPGTPRNSFTMS